MYRKQKLGQCQPTNITKNLLKNANQFSCTIFTSLFMCLSYVYGATSSSIQIKKPTHVS